MSVLCGIKLLRVILYTYSFHRIIYTAVLCIIRDREIIVECHENAKVGGFMEINGCGGIVYYDLTRAYCSWFSRNNAFLCHLVMVWLWWFYHIYSTGSSVPLNPFRLFYTSHDVTVLLLQYPRQSLYTYFSKIMRQWFSRFWTDLHTQPYAWILSNRYKQGTGCYFLNFEGWMLSRKLTRRVNGKACKNRKRRKLGKITLVFSPFIF